LARDGRLRYRKGGGERGGMTYIDYGLSILPRDLVLGRVPPDGPSDLADLFADLGEGGDLAGYEVRERFYEIGSDQGLADLEALLAGRAGVAR
jgi:hypothetical protein